jgi:hypothetical protein
MKGTTWLVESHLKFVMRRLMNYSWVRMFTSDLTHGWWRARNISESTVCYDDGLNRISLKPNKHKTLPHLCACPKSVHIFPSASVILWTFSSLRFPRGVVHVVVTGDHYCLNFLFSKSSIDHKEHLKWDICQCLSEIYLLLNYFRPKTWSCISDMRGETTTVVLPVNTDGYW